MRIGFVLALLAGTAGQAWADAGDNQYAVAAGHYSLSRWQLAALEFQAFLDDYPEHRKAAKASFFLGEALVQLGQNAEARTAFVNYLRFAPGGPYAPQALFRSGETAYLAGEAAEARMYLEHFRATYADDALNAYVLPYLAEMALRENDGRAAERLFAAALNEFGEGTMRDDCRFGMARAIELQGRREEAAKQYRQMIADSDFTLADRAALHLGALEYSNKNFAGAAKTLAAFENRFAKSRLRPNARLGRAQALYQLAKYDEALSLLTELVADPSLGFEARYWQGLAQKGRQDWKQAAKTLIETADRYPNHALAPTMRFHAADCLLRAGEHAAAIAQLERLDGADEQLAASAEYLLALSYQGQKRHRDALGVLNGLQETAEGDMQANVATARATSLIALKRYDEAIDPLEHYLSEQPGGEAAEHCRAELAICYARTGKLNQAREALEQLKQEHPASSLLPAALQHVAEAATQAGDRKTAGELFSSLAKEGKSAAVASQGLLGLAWNQYHEGDLEGADRTLRQLLDNHPDDKQAAQAAVLRGRVLEDLNKPDAALAMYRTVMEKQAADKEAANATLAAARLHEKLGQGREATELYKTFLREQADHPEREAATYEQAWLLRDLGRPAEAAAHFEQLRALSPQGRYWADATYRLAEMARTSKDYKRARELLAELVEADTAGDIVPHAFYLQGQLAVETEDWDDVQQTLGRLVANYPDSSLRMAAEYWMAEAVYRQGRSEEAAQRFAALSVQAQNRREKWLGVIPLRHAQALAQLGKWEEAQAAAKSIAQQFPNFEQQYEVDYLLGRCHSSQGQFDSARQAYRRVTGSTRGGKTETAAMAQWMIGESYFHQKDHQAALREYLRVEILYAYPRWQAGALLQAGKCYEQLNQRKAAVELYVRILKQFPNTEFTDEAARRLRSAQADSTTVTR